MRRSVLRGLSTSDDLDDLADAGRETSEGRAVGRAAVSDLGDLGLVVAITRSDYNVDVGDVSAAVGRIRSARRTRPGVAGYARSNAIPVSVGEAGHAELLVPLVVEVHIEGSAGAHIENLNLHEGVLVGNKLAVHERLADEQVWPILGERDGGNRQEQRHNEQPRLDTSVSDVRGPTSEMAAPSASSPSQRSQQDGT